MVTFNKLLNYEELALLTKGDTTKIFLKTYVFDVTNLDNEKYNELMDGIGSADNYFSNKHLVFTGTLSELSRDEAKYLAKTKGAKILSSISKKTDFLIAGEKAGSKIDKATKLGIKILNEKDFLEKINL